MVYVKYGRLSFWGEYLTGGNFMKGMAKSKPGPLSTIGKILKRTGCAFKLRTRLIISFLVPILAIVIIGVSSYSSSKSEITRIAIDSSQEVINGEIAYFDMLVNIVSSHAKQLMTNSDVRTALKPDFRDLERSQQIETTNRINSLLSSLATSKDYIKDYSIIGVNHCIYTNST